MLQLQTVAVDKPETVNFIPGQSHFIKSVEDIHEALVGTVPGIRFSFAFCEASGKRLVRHSGTDAALVDLACRNASAIGAGHAFIVFLGDGCFPSTYSTRSLPCRRSAGSIARARTRPR